jgi:hypothetical protein
MNTSEDFKTYQAESDYTVAQFEKEYPELSQEFKIIQDEMYRMFAAKHMDYGLQNISLGGDLTKENDRRENREGMEDTFIDIANYGIIGMLVGRDKWKK